MSDKPVAVAGGRTRRLGNVGQALPLLLVGLAFAAWALGHINVYAFSNDEGMPLMWARLMRDGYVLYRDIWCDHPPLLQWAMLGIMALVGESVSPLWGRALMVLVSSVGLLGLGALSWRAARCPWAGALAGAMLALSPLFNWFGRAIMPDIPANCVAVLAVLAALAGRRRLPLALVSGALFATSLMVKLVTLPLAPVVLVALLYGVRGRRDEGRLLVAWGAGLLVVLSLVAAFLDVGAAYRLIVGTVVGAREARGWDAAETLGRWWEFLADGHIGLLGFALLGSVWSLRHRTPAAVALLAWLGLATLALLVHYPLYEHHLALVLFPLVGLAGVGAAQVVQSGRWRWAAGVAWVAYALAFPLTWEETFLPSTPRDADNWEIVSDLESLSPPRGWIVTDSTLLAFQAGLRIPPPLITGGKRLESGLLSSDTLIRETIRWQPQVIAFVRSDEDVALPYLAWVEQNYHLSRRYSSSRRIWTLDADDP